MGLCNGIEIIGHVWGTDGFSETNRDLALSLRDKGFPVRLLPLHPPEQISSPAKLPADIQMKIQSTCQVNLPEKYLSLHHYSIQGIQFVNQVALGSVYYGVYETNSYPLVWQYMMRRAPLFKEIWTPSTFCAKTLAPIGLPMRTIPHGININRFTPEGEKFSIQGVAGFNFLSAMTFKKIKGYDILLKAYLEEFITGKEDVSLTLKAYVGSNNLAQEKSMVGQYIQKMKQDTKSKARVLMVVEPLSYDDMPALHRSADCFILPTRGEGWGKNIMESMACEVPAIVSNATGPKDYITKDNSLLVDGKEEEIQDIEWLLREPVSAGHSWFEPNLDQLKKQMRWAYEHPAELKLLGKQARQDILKYDWPNIADMFIEQTMKFGELYDR